MDSLLKETDYLSSKKGQEGSKEEERPPAMRHRKETLEDPRFGEIREEVQEEENITVKFPSL